MQDLTASFVILPDIFPNVRFLHSSLHHNVVLLGVVKCKVIDQGHNFLLLQSLDIPAVGAHELGVAGRALYLDVEGERQRLQLDGPVVDLDIIGFMVFLVDLAHQLETT